MTENLGQNNLLELIRHNYATEANQRYSAELNAAATRYAADTSASATRYAAATNAAATKYVSDNNLIATRETNVSQENRNRETNASNRSVAYSNNATRLETTRMSSEATKASAKYRTTGGIVSGLLGAVGTAASILTK